MGEREIMLTLNEMNDTFFSYTSNFDVIHNYIARVSIESVQP